MPRLLVIIALIFAILASSSTQLNAADPVAASNVAIQKDLVGYWKLQGDCRDHSGHNNHGINHDVDLTNNRFNGSTSYIEIPANDSLKLGTGDFSLTAWVYTDKIVNSTLGDVISFFDPSRRKGLTLNLKSSSGGYQSSGDDRHIYFGIDDASVAQWQDCGRPSLTSNYVSNSLTVYKGHLYAAITDAKNETDWCHVFRYEGGQKWADCGRVGTGKTTGVMALIVHDGHLFAGTSTYDWTRVFSGEYDTSHVYRYEGGTTWTNCGAPGDMLRINCLATYDGKLYVGGDRGMPIKGETQWTGRPYHVYVYEKDKQWRVAGTFPAEPPGNCYPHAMSVHDGKLYVGYPNVYVFDGKEWKFAGTPIGDTPPDQKPHLQVHSLEVFRGRLIAGMWPEARIVEYQGGTTWVDRGQLGEGTEVNALTIYNGMLYGGTIPHGEVSRYDGNGRWTSLRRFFSPPNWNPGPPTDPVRDQINFWTRVTSLTVFDGKLFASIGSCTSSAKDAPADVRGKVFSMQAGQCVSYDNDLGPGWKHITALRHGGELKLYVNGKLASKSAPFNTDDYNLSVDKSLFIGFGEQDYFTGRIQEVRLYRRALVEQEIATLQENDMPLEK